MLSTPRPPAALRPPAASPVAPSVSASDLDSCISKTEAVKWQLLHLPGIRTLKTPFAYIYSYLTCSSIDEVTHLPAKTNLPILALDLVAFYLFRKLTLLMIPSFSCLFTISHYPLAFNFIHFSQGLKPFPWNALHHFYSFPPSLFKAFIIGCLHDLPLTRQTNLVASLTRLSLKLPVVSILLKPTVTFLSPPPEALKSLSNSTCPHLKPRSSAPSLILFCPNLLLFLTSFLAEGSGFP